MKKKLVTVSQNTNVCYRFIGVQFDIDHQCQVAKNLEQQQQQQRGKKSLLFIDF